jgi:ribosomal protein S18 acetylase RimI-like enzyme
MSRENLSQPEKSKGIACNDEEGGKAVRASSEELSIAIEESFVDLFSTLCTASPDAVLRHEEEMTIYSSGYPNSLLNGVLAPKFTRESMAGQTERALSFFIEKRLPMTFFVGPSSTPESLDNHLLKRGLEPGWSRPGMAIDLDSVCRRPLPKGLEICEVDGYTPLQVCASAFARGFVVGDDVIGWVRDLVLGYGFGAKRRWLVGFLNGKPVSTSLLAIHKGIAGIYCVATLQEARGRGIGTALTLEPLLLAKEMGHEYAVLQSSKLGLSVYEKLGFKEYCKIRAYVWHPK